MPRCSQCARPRFYARPWAERHHLGLPTSLAMRFMAFLVATNAHVLAYEVQLLMARSFWERFTDTVSQETVEVLLECLPTPHEQNEMTKYLASGEDTSRLGEAETFCRRVMPFANASKALQALLFERSAGEEFASVEHAFDLIQGASEQLRGCGLLADILHGILAIGNAMNRGGEAVAFTLASLCNLTVTQCRAVDAHLLHYVISATSAAQGVPPTELAATLLEELSLLGAINAVDLNDVQDKVVRLSTQLDAISEGEEHMWEWAYALRLRVFNKRDAVSNELHSLSRYFGEDSLGVSAVSLAMMLDVEKFVRAYVEAASDGRVMSALQRARRACSGQPAPANAPTRRLNWVPIPPPAIHAIGDDTLWAHQTCAPYHVPLAAEIPVLFSMRSAAKEAKCRPEGVKGGPAVVEANTRDWSKAYPRNLHNIGIRLATRRLLAHPLKVSRQLEAMDPSMALDPSDLEALREAAPLEEDVRILRDHYRHVAFLRWASRKLSPRDRLTDTEKMLWCLAHVPHAAQRAQVLTIQRTFDQRLDEIVSQITDLKRSYTAVLESKGIMALLSLVRCAGNILNNYSVPTKAFNLMSLHNLQDTRCNGVAASLLDYVAHATTRWGFDIEDLDAQMSALRVIPIEALRRDLASLSDDVQRVAASAQELGAGVAPQTTMDFLDVAHLGLESAHSAMSSAQATASELTRHLPGLDAMNTVTSARAFSHALAESQRRTYIQRAISRQVAAVQAF